MRRKISLKYAFLIPTHDESGRILLPFHDLKAHALFEALICLKCKSLSSMYFLSSKMSEINKYIARKDGSDIMGFQCLKRILDASSV